MLLLDLQKDGGDCVVWFRVMFFGVQASPTSLGLLSFGSEGFTVALLAVAVLGLAWT